MRMTKGNRLPRLCAIVLALALHPSAASAQSVEEFYKGRQINMLIGGGAGGGYDVYYRALARNLGKHIPGHPSIIPPSNQPAASGLAAAAALYTTSEKDGSVSSARSPTTSPWTRCSATRRALATTRSSSTGSARLESCRTSARPGTRARWRPIEQAQQREVVVGGGGATEHHDDAAGAQRAHRHPFRLIFGYDPGAGLTISVERGEAEGICGLSWSTMKASRPHWIKDKLLNVIVQLGMEKLPDLPNAPGALDLVKDPHKKRVLKFDPDAAGNRSAAGGTAGRAGRSRRGLAARV